MLYYNDIILDRETTGSHTNQVWLRDILTCISKGKMYRRKKEAHIEGHIECVACNSIHFNASQIRAKENIPKHLLELLCKYRYIQYIYIVISEDWESKVKKHAQARRKWIKKGIFQCLANVFIRLLTRWFFSSIGGRGKRKRRRLEQ